MENAEDVARDWLQQLKKVGNIWEYIKEFTSLVLQKLDLLEMDSLFYFMNGLQPWTKIELKRYSLQDSANVDYFNLKDSSKPKERKANIGKGGGEPSRSKNNGRDNSTHRL